MGTKVNHIAQALKLRARAEECRRLAELTKDRQSATSYLGLADSYEKLAHTEEALAERAPEKRPP